MIKIDKINMVNEVISIDGEEYVKASYIIKNYKVSTQRLRLWRNGRGQGRFYTLRTIGLSKRMLLYNKKDVKELMEMTRIMKVKIEE